MSVSLCFIHQISRDKRYLNFYLCMSVMIAYVFYAFFGGNQMHSLRLKRIFSSQDCVIWLLHWLIITLLSRNLIMFWLLPTWNYLISFEKKLKNCFTEVMDMFLGDLLNVLIKVYFKKVLFTMLWTLSQYILETSKIPWTCRQRILITLITFVRLLFKLITHYGTLRIIVKLIEMLT